MLFPILTSIIVIIIDQLVKYWTVNHLALFESAPGVAPFFDFYYIRNDGAGWGLLSGRQTLFLVITVGVLIYLIYLIYEARDSSLWYRLSLGLILGGAIGNFVDRLLYRYVIDMIRLTFINFPIFNIADVALSLGVIGLLIYLLWDETQEKKAGNIDVAS